MTANASLKLKWNGIHHLAILTHDLDVTIAFYRDLLGMTIGDVASSPRGRHRFIQIEPEASGRPGIHVWEDTSRKAPDVTVHRGQFNSGPGVVAHLALYLPDRESEIELRSRLDMANVEVTEFERLGTFAFWDPNGILVEVVPSAYDEMLPHS